MLAMVNSCCVHGLNGYNLTVEVDLSAGLSAFDIVGLPDASVRESRERVRAALKNSGYDFFIRRITVNLAPADIRKEGPSLDLPIAIGILVAQGYPIPEEALEGSAFVGELSLDGSVRPIDGALSIADHLSGTIRRLFIPKENAAEASLAANLEVYPISHLTELVDFLIGRIELEPLSANIDDLLTAEQGEYALDMAEVKGQKAAKRALEIAAAGGHNILMIGSPGSGKTMLARRLPTILPELTLEESLLVTKIYSVAGQLPRGQALITKRPFRSPHHGASAVSIIGGGAIPRPGEISLASQGALFLDELPEFGRDVLESLRQPLEEQIVTVSRAKGRADFPADFQLVAAMNPCPCGFFGDSKKECTCSPAQRLRYFGRLSGPFLDRVDLHITIPRVEYQDLAGRGAAEESSAAIRARVCAARDIQYARFAGSDTRINGRMSRRQVEQFCHLTPEASQVLESAFSYLNMSARAHDRILKVSRTIADLANTELIQVEHIAEAIQYRSLDREII